MSSTSASASEPVVELSAPSSREQLERTSEPRLLQTIARLEQLAAGRVDARTLAHRHHRREHRQAGGVGAGHLDTRAASASAGSTSRSHGSRPCLLQSSWRPAGTPGTAQEAMPTCVVDELVPERDADVVELDSTARRAEAAER